MQSNVAVEPKVREITFYQNRLESKLIRIESIVTELTEVLMPISVNQQQEDTPADKQEMCTCTPLGGSLKRFDEQLSASIYRLEEIITNIQL